MNKYINNQILPEGFKVLLPNEAQKEELISRKILDILIKKNYALVKTPIIEYQSPNINSLYTKDTIHEPFILIEPDTKKILVIRSDITPQIAKLASTKLNHIKRPLRLMYSGEVLRNIKNLYQSDRQFKQIGAELIGASHNKGLLEIIKLANSIIKSLKMKNTTIDFSVPSLMRYLEKIIDFKKTEGKMIREAIENKDSSIITNKKYNYLKSIIECSGTLDEAKKNFKKSSFPSKINIILENFFKSLNYLKKNNSDISITVDISEGNNFLNYQNIGFKIYNKNDSSVIAIGGDYILENKELGIGITLITNNICSAFKYINRKGKF
ncbi:MAG: ATP phosphoribosyltransferase regulatory subunit [Alphaproteobacteria bacterium MarineAlpha9_Bin4]|nr:hypothetical protein [Pelagibacterales bacterium]PPR26953.1 MAG: ATP phosphoribosyltransferase regulatory subunit [Alphaproteobacteria bacterium MarineAlpha9_Bin4]|tara:strand:- start:73 stop:1047 length:975 start_codon:yes stop_codon:yes gene_type:complete